MTDLGLRFTYLPHIYQVASICPSKQQVVFTRVPKCRKEGNEVVTVAQLLQCLDLTAKLLFFILLIVW